MSSLLPAQTFVNTMLPQPAHLSAGAGSLPWTDTLTVGVPHFHDQRLDDSIARSLEQLERKTGVHRQRSISASSTSTLVIDVDGAGEAIQSLDENESYTLTVTSSNATIHAATVVGAMRGLATLLQLIQTDGKTFFVPAVAIGDSPRFRWRGLMIDVGRHFEPIAVIKRNLDAMAAVKLNVFHWHLTEDQGFRIESKLYPELTANGSDGLYYTQEEAKDIVAYARARGIRVVPEFDMPGHTRAWLVGRPDLSSDPGPYTIRREFGVEAVAMDPTKESTYQLLDAFIGEMATIFPDPYLHLGGDEAPGTQWKNNAHVTAFMREHNFKTTEELQTYFSQRVLEVAKKHGKHMVGWDEILTPTLPTDAIIHSWRGAKSLYDAAQRGYQGILSQPYYLDGMKSAEEHYLADPLPASSTLTPEQRKFVLGGEVCMWASTSISSPSIHASGRVRPLSPNASGRQRPSPTSTICTAASLLSRYVSKPSASPTSRMRAQPFVSLPAPRTSAPSARSPRLFNPSPSANAIATSTPTNSRRSTMSWMPCVRTLRRAIRWPCWCATSSNRRKRTAAHALNSRASSRAGRIPPRQSKRRWTVRLC